MKNSTLSDHKFEKGKFITPMNAINIMWNNDSWIDNRLPEYIWIWMILEQYDRETGFNKVKQIFEFLYTIAPQVPLPCLSEILLLEDSVQARFFQKLIDLTDQNILTPLTVVLTHNEYPVFSILFSSHLNIESRREKLLSIIDILFNHQSNEATDVRYCILLYMITNSKIMLVPEQQIAMLNDYPMLSHDDELMSSYRPSIRVSEVGMLDHIKEANLKTLQHHSQYTEMFWGGISTTSECKLTVYTRKQKDIDITLYMEYLYEIFNYLTNCYVKIDPLDDKIAVILGMSIYAYKRLKEICEYKLGTSIVSRGTLRVIIENYIMIKYLLKEEGSHPNIWQEYQYYGLGLYKLVVSKWRESNKDDKNSVFDTQYIEALISEFKMEEFLDIDIRYFDKKKIRLKAEAVGEKELYGFYYDYFSSFEHGLWGAVRETSFMKCINPMHKHHIIPDINCEITLKNIEFDCIMVMNKLITLLNELYGIPEDLYKKVMEYEQYINQEN